MKSINDISRQIQPTLESVEKFRLDKLEAISQATKLYYVPFFMVITSFVLYFFNMIPYAVLLGIIGLIGIVLVYMLKIRPLTNGYTQHFKREVFTSFVNALYPNTTYIPDDCVPDSLFKMSRLYSSYNKYNGEDYFEGKTTNGCNFKFSELNVLDTSTYTDSDGNSKTRTTTIFDGLFFVLTVPVKVRGFIQVLPDFAQSNFGSIGKYIQKSLGSMFHEGNMVYLEDYPEFEKEFVVYSQNEEEAFRILTSELIQSIYDLRFKWNKKLRLSFVDNEIYLALATYRDFFNPDIYQSVLQSTLLHELYNELALCFSVVENLSVKQNPNYNPNRANQPVQLDRYDKDRNSDNTI
ncbi:MAG: DUF3137 domain-containing protein [Saprospiraceae bacterium]|nr:DUF3137 domain-containing protein [Saprospiraceae bacterium]